MKQFLFILAVVVFCFSPISIFSQDSGEQIFNNKCLSCHTIGQGRLIGPDLRGVTSRRDQKWLMEVIKSTQSLLKKEDAELRLLVAEYGLIMPDSGLSDEEIKAVLAYLQKRTDDIAIQKKEKTVHRKRQTEKYPQPIDFSHKLHAGDHKINCLYCHFGAERSRHAGIPPANVCLNCHSQIKIDSPEIKKIHEAVQSKQPIVWKKRHDLPDHVYFNHSAHVKAGVSCQTCHGAVETMKQPTPRKIQMGWCVNCHREEDRVIPSPPGEESYKKLIPARTKNITKLDCARCHH